MKIKMGKQIVFKKNPLGMARALKSNATFDKIIANLVRYTMRMNDEPNES
jgi:hypothetical protein